MNKKSLNECKKIGIMGGTFNPIHVGHLLMGQWAKEFAGLDAVIFIPTGNPYMKEQSEILDGAERLKMVCYSIENQEGFYASDIEINRKGNTYTYETLQQLRGIYPNASFYFIAGADCLYSFDRWVHPELILQNCTMIAAARNGAATRELEDRIKLLTERFGGQILLMEFPTFEVSSTMLRQRLQEGKSIRYLTTDKVCDYIEANGLYLS